MISHINAINNNIELKNINYMCLSTRRDIHCPPYYRCKMKTALFVKGT